MGIDLKLLTFDSDFFSHTVLNCFRRRDLFKEILVLEKLKGVDVPENFCSYVSRANNEDSHYGVTTHTPYGGRLKYVVVANLLQFRDHIDVNDNCVNRAIWAYLEQLPPQNRVALFWS